MKIEFHFESRDGLTKQEEHDLPAISKLPDRIIRPLRVSIGDESEDKFPRRTYLLDDVTEEGDRVSAFYKEI